MAHPSLVRLADGARVQPGLTKARRGDGETATVLARCGDGTGSAEHGHVFRAALFSARFGQHLAVLGALLSAIGGPVVPRVSFALFVVAASLTLGGCMQATLSPSTDASMTPRDRQLLAHVPYAQANVPEQYLRHIVDYPRKELPGTILVDTDARYLYYVLPEGKAIRYGVAVGEEAMAFSGVARVGRMAEWPDWVPTAEIQARLGPYPARVPGGPANPLGARGIYLYVGDKDTLYRIHGTNQPEYIGQAISSGCIRMRNEDVIDLFDRVKLNATVVVLPPGQSAQVEAGPSWRG